MTVLVFHHFSSNSHDFTKANNQKFLVCVSLGTIVQGPSGVGEVEADGLFLTRKMAL